MPRRIPLIVFVMTAIALTAGIVQPDVFLATTITTFAIWALWGVSWDWVYTYGGEVTLGQAGFAVIGAYTAVLLLTTLHVPIVLGWLGGVLAAMLTAGLIGLLSLRLRGAYFSLATLSFAAVILSLILQFSGITGGANGIALTFTTQSIANLEFFQPGIYFGIAGSLVAVVVALTYYTQKTRLGLQLRALAADPIAAEALGINVNGLKLAVLAISSAVAATAGLLYTVSVGYADPSYLSSLTLSMEIAIVAIVGGAGSPFGPVVGAAIYTALQVATNFISGTGGGLEVLVDGVILILIILLDPRGVTHLLGRLGAQRRSEPPLGAQRRGGERESPASRIVSQ